MQTTEKTKLYREDQDERHARAFNAGSDASLSGRTLDDNPYRVETNSAEWSAWRRGWKHCDSHFGEDVRR
jgi:hypothetical protein